MELIDDEVIAIADCIAKFALIKLSLYNIASNAENVSEPEDNICIIEEAIKKSSVRILNLCESGFYAIAEQIIYLIVHSQITNFEISLCAIEEQIILIEAIKCNAAINKITCGHKYASFADRLLIKICDLTEDKNSALIAINMFCHQFTNEQFTKICNSIKGSSIALLGVIENKFDGEKISTIYNLLTHHELIKLSIGKLTSDTLVLMLLSVKLSSLTKFGIECADISDNM